MFIFFKKKIVFQKIFFFYQGAFKLLKKKYNIKTEFVIDLTSEFTIPSTIHSIFSKIYEELPYKHISLTPKQNEFLDLFDKISDKVLLITNKINHFKKDFSKKKIFYNSYDNLTKILNHSLKCIDEIIELLKDYEVECNELNKYYEFIKDFIDLNSSYKLTYNHLILMELNYKNKINLSYINDIEKYIYYAKLYNEFDKYAEEDYSDIFRNIINSDKFKELYLKAMKSSFIINFTKELNIYNIYLDFINNYANKINEYIIYAPLTRGIKAYVSNYFRIVLNINSIEIIGNFDCDYSKTDLIVSYILIQFLHESFHFLFRLNKIGYITINALSPKRDKIKETYNEIGVDLIIYLFGTEYITFISKKNSILINDPKSWENPKTNFKVFNKVYLSNFKLVDEKDKEISYDSGLKCNISQRYEFNNEDDLKICTDETIKYCF